MSSYMLYLVFQVDDGHHDGDEGWFSPDSYEFLSSGDNSARDYALGLILGWVNDPDYLKDTLESSGRSRDEEHHTIAPYTMTLIEEKGHTPIAFWRWDDFEMGDDELWHIKF